MSEPNDIVAAIRRGLEKPGKTQRGLAEAIGRDETVVSKILAARRLVKAKELPLISAYLELSTLDGYQNPENLPSALKQEFTAIPLYDIHQPLGDARVATEIAASGKMMFDRSWLARLSPSPQDLFVMEIGGDAMLGTLNDGDHALVDPHQAQVHRDGLYALQVEDAAPRVRRLSLHPITRKVTIKCDNPNYPTYADIEPADLALIGRVVWVGRKL